MMQNLSVHNSLEFCQLTQADRTEQALINYMVTPYDPYNDPMLQAHFFRSESDILCIKVNYIVYDAGALKEYIRFFPLFTEIAEKISS